MPDLLQKFIFEFSCSVVRDNTSSFNQLRFWQDGVEKFAMLYSLKMEVLQWCTVSPYGDLMERCVLLVLSSVILLLILLFILLQLSSFLIYL